MYKWTGAYILMGLKPQQKKCFETSTSSADQSTFCIYWFLIKLQNNIVNRIHINTKSFWRGIFIWEGGGVAYNQMYCFVYRQMGL